mmetsp:Transcript_12168/g.29919  ORF Transcript_12168/g.29919 Transcript_12168/m.29919 type:complete len:325 (+) Transcript_12168:504-1478(+)
MLSLRGVGVPAEELDHLLNPLPLQERRVRVVALPDVALQRPDPQEGAAHVALPVVEDDLLLVRGLRCAPREERAELRPHRRHAPGERPHLRGHALGRALPLRFQGVHHLLIRQLFAYGVRAKLCRAHLLPPPHVLVVVGDEEGPLLAVNPRQALLEPGLTHSVAELAQKGLRHSDVPLLGVDIEVVHLGEVLRVEHARPSDEDVISLDADRAAVDQRRDRAGPHGGLPRLVGSLPALVPLRVGVVDYQDHLLPRPVGRRDPLEHRLLDLGLLRVGQFLRLHTVHILRVVEDQRGDPLERGGEVGLVGVGGDVHREVPRRLCRRR